MQEHILEPSLAATEQALWVIMRIKGVGSGSDLIVVTTCEEPESQICALIELLQQESVRQGFR